MKDAILTFLFIITSLLLAAIFKIPLVIGFAVALMLVIILVICKGYTWREITVASYDGFKRIKPVIYILGLISLLIPSWIMSGTVPTMIYYIVNWIEPTWILLFAFFITAITSFILGTAIGTLGSLGIILVGVAIAVDVPIALVAGALVSGAFVGDRCSPLSSAFHLAANSVEVNPKKLFRNMLPTTLLLIFLSSFIYFIAGFFIQPKGITENMVVTNLLQENFHISIVTLLPIVVLFGSILLKVRTIFSLGLGVITGILIAVTLQDLSIVDILRNLGFGYSHSSTGLEDILRGGGILTMGQLFLFITLASMMNGILDRTQLFKVFMKKMFDKACSLTSYTARTASIGIIFAIVGCNQAFPVMLTGRSLKSTWEEAGYKKEELGRVVCDSALVISGLVPWNMVAILSAAAIGVSTVEYALFAVFLWLGPIVTILISFFRKGKYEGIYFEKVANQ
ncbi:Na+/H+ antiporter NhaC family protein [Bacillus sp. FJAT-45350]|uniref:Na+/H+ antiporter NhaC family protein n=1 Tax=Bacillus sp. FJAT-45350 TaxID=2011014 RepID=UPI000BB965F0|nr:Na+/H+ antiporter NhaC family protein [Bacillus sp. FJAT-45350]